MLIHLTIRSDAERERRATPIEIEGLVTAFALVILRSLFLSASSRFPMHLSYQMLP